MRIDWKAINERRWLRTKLSPRQEIALCALISILTLLALVVWILSATL